MSWKNHPDNDSFTNWIVFYLSRIDTYLHDKWWSWWHICCCVLACCSSVKQHRNKLLHILQNDLFARQSLILKITYFTLGIHAHAVSLCIANHNYAWQTLQPFVGSHFTVFLIKAIQWPEKDAYNPSKYCLNILRTKSHLPRIAQTK